jgi:hypothetical protein
MARHQQAVESANHHYVPKFYLKGFTDKKGYLWAYEFGKNAPRQSDPKHEGHREDYYTFADRGYPDDSAEKMLSRAESLVAPTIRKLANPQFKMNEQQISELYTFVALMYVRVPAYREFVNVVSAKMIKEFAQNQALDNDKFYEILKDYETKTGRSVGDHKKLREFLLSNDYTVTQDSVAFNLLHTFQSCLDISETLEKQYGYDLYYAPVDSFFMTCDNPIATIEPDFMGSANIGSGVGRPRTEVVFPLNKRACLILRRYGKGRHISASQVFIDQINNLIMKTAQRYAYAPVGFRRLARIFNERGCTTRYGVNALIPDPTFISRTSTE